MVLGVRRLVGKATVRCILINRRRKFARQSRQEFFLGQTGLLLERGQYILSDGLLELGGGKFFVRSFAYPGLCGISLAVLFEPLEQFAKPAAQQASDAAAG